MYFAGISPLLFYFSHTFPLLLCVAQIRFNNAKWNLTAPHTRTHRHTRYTQDVFDFCVER